jgi:hypothetical protein
MGGRNKKPGKWNLSGNEHELEEYFAELGSEEPNDGSPQPNTVDQGKVGLSATEEVRRLTAYVAHLREEVARFRQAQPPLPKRPLPNSAGAIVGFAVMVGVASVVGIIARRWSRLR